MRAPPPPAAWRDRPWAALCALPAYFQRLLTLLGLAAADDPPDLALLSGALVRVRTASAPRLTLSCVAPSAPLALVPADADAAAAAHPGLSLFVLHFDAAGLDAARLATAHPTPAGRRAWVAVDPRDGSLTLAADEDAAASFQIRRPRSAPRGVDAAAAVVLAAPSAAGALLAACDRASSAEGGGGGGDGRRRRRSRSSGGDENRGVRVCAPESVAGADAARCCFVINAAATTPEAALGAWPTDDDGAALAEVMQRAVALPVRLQSVRRGWFVASNPGADLAAARRREPGWDVFTVEYDYASEMARIRDARGKYLVLAPGLRAFRAGATVDGVAEAKTATPGADGQGLSGGKTVPEAMATQDVELAGKEEGGVSGGAGKELPRAERFVIVSTGEDDRVALRSRKGYLSARRNGTLVISQDSVPGQDEQFFMRIALPSMMDQSSASLRLRHLPHGVREVEAGIVVPCSAEMVYGVLCDYDGFKRFITDCSASELVSSNADDGTLVVRMSQAHSFLVLTISMTMTLRVRELRDERKVTMDLMHGMGVRTYNGAWWASELSSDRCRLRVKISSSPAVPAPNFLVDGVMTHAVTSTLDEIRKEAMLRSTEASGGDGGT